jgi:hypothetical protein
MTYEEMAAIGRSQAKPYIDDGDDPWSVHMRELRLAWGKFHARNSHLCKKMVETPNATKKQLQRQGVKHHSGRKGRSVGDE